MTDIAMGLARAEQQRGVGQQHRLVASGLLDVRCARSLVAVLGVEADFVALVEGAEAFAVDCALVDEEILRAVIRGDEAEALVRVEPLDCSAWHLCPP